MWPKKFLTLLLLLILVPVRSWAEGSVSYFSDMRPLLEARPDLAESISGLTISRIGVARRIGHAVSPRLAGLRIGPYIFNAETPRHALLEVTFNTNVDFLDETGAVIAKIVDGNWVDESGFARAVNFREQLSSIEIRAKRVSQP